MYRLCAMIEKERDHAKFLQLIQELNQLLERSATEMAEDSETIK